MRMFRTWLAAAALALGLIAAPPSVGLQSNLWSPTTGTVTGLQLTTAYNSAFTSMASSNSGATSPTNDISAGPVKGQWWLDTSTTPNTIRMYSGAAWVPVANLDQTNASWSALIANPVFAVTAAATTDLCGSGVLYAANLGIVGSTGITSFGTSCPNGSWKTLVFLGAPVLTNSAALILPTLANITTASGDTMTLVYTTGTGWRVMTYQRASGVALSTSANFTSTVNFNSTIVPGGLSTNTNNWNPAGLATANVIRYGCITSNVNITGLAAPATDGQVLVLVNIGATLCTFTAFDGASTGTNQFKFEAPYVARPGTSLTIKYSAGEGGWVVWQEPNTKPNAGSFKNLRVLNVANEFGDAAPGTPNNQMRIFVDEIVVENSAGGAFRIDGSVAGFPCTLDITGSGAGGLDTGTSAVSTWYFLWAIYNPTTNVASCLASVSSTTPSMPAGYTYKARVGANRTDASANKCFYRIIQYGRIANYINTGANAGCSADNSFGNPQVAQGAAGVGGVVNSPTSGVSRQITGNGFVAPTTAGRVQMMAITWFNGNGCTFAQMAPNANYFGAQNGMGGQNNLIWPISTQGIASQWATLETNSMLYWANSTNTGGCAVMATAWEDSL